MKKIIFIFLFLTSCNDYHYPSDVICIQRGIMQEWLDSTNNRIAYFRLLRKEQSDSMDVFWKMVDSIQDNSKYSYKKGSPERTITDSIMNKILEPISNRKSNEYDLIMFYKGRAKTFEILLEHR